MSQDLTLSDTVADELPAIHAMEHEPGTRDFVIPYSLDEHRAALRRADVVYQSLRDARRRLVGFMILVLDSDGESVEFRRIVIADKGRGYGRRAVALLDELCRDRLGRSRIWLDVFEHNARARRLYEFSGYRQVSTAVHEGRPLRVYEKRLTP